MPGRWQPVVQQPAHNVNLMLLLTDGRVMAFEPGGVRLSALTPDGNGSYTNGTWDELAPMAHSRLYFESAVLADGRVFVAGGEYGTGNVSVELYDPYDPVQDRWRPGALPPWPYVSDEPCCLLDDGTLLAGFGRRSGIYDPQTDTWSEVATPMSGDCYETTWTLLPDGSVLQPYMLSHPASQRFVPSLRRWVDAGNVPADLVPGPGDLEEVGPALLLYDGRVFEIGATGHTDFYTPPADPGGEGEWTVGPELPAIDGGGALTARDAPACLLPNGRALVCVGPVYQGSGEARGFSGPPTVFLEFADNEWIPVTAPPNAGDAFTFACALLLLPSGEALYSRQTPELWLYASDPADGGPHANWRPQVTHCARRLVPGNSYTLFGRQLNGLSQAVSYGDDLCAATNYPLVRLTDTRTREVRYCRTHGHSNMGVAAIDGWTNFDVPTVAPGAYSLEVVANGIPSEPLEVEVLAAPTPHLPRYELWQRLIGSLADGHLVELRGNHPVPVDPFPFAEAAGVLQRLLSKAFGEDRPASSTSVPNPHPGRYPNPHHASRARESG